MQINMIACAACCLSSFVLAQEFVVCREVPSIEARVPGCVAILAQGCFCSIACAACLSRQAFTRCPRRNGTGTTSLRRPSCRHFLALHELVMAVELSRWTGHAARASGPTTRRAPHVAIAELHRAQLPRSQRLQRRRRPRHRPRERPRSLRPGSVPRRLRPRLLRWRPRWLRLNWPAARRTW